MSTKANLQHLRLIAEVLDDAAARQVESAIAELEAARRRAVAVLGTCDKHRTSPVHIYSNCAGCELERLNAEVESLKNKARWATENHNQLDALAQRCRELEHMLKHARMDADTHYADALTLRAENDRLRTSIPQPDWKLCTACRAMHPPADFAPAPADFPTRDGLNHICRKAAAERRYQLRRLPDGKVEPKPSP